MTCNRALFELTVDLILLSEGGPIHTPERMYSWEQSAKLKAAEATLTYYSQADRSVPEIFAARVDFIRRKKKDVENQRRTFWSSTHPNRWTGSGLSVDAKRADELRAREISEDLDTSLLEFYETQMRRMHMTVHGSALALERYLSPEGFHVVCVLAYKWSTDLAVFCTKLILTDLGFSTKLPELRDEWEKVKADRLVIYEDYRPILSSDEEFEE